MRALRLSFLVEKPPTILPSLSEVVEVVSTKVERPTTTLIAPLKPPPILSEDIWGELKNEVRRTSIEPDIEEEQEDDIMAESQSGEDSREEATENVLQSSGMGVSMSQDKNNADEGTTQDDETDEVVQMSAVRSEQEGDADVTQNQDEDVVPQKDAEEENLDVHDDGLAAADTLPVEQSDEGASAEVYMSVMCACR